MKTSSVAASRQSAAEGLIQIELRRSAETLLRCN